MDAVSATWMVHAPVVALGVGGALDTVVPGVSGALVHPDGDSREAHVSAFAAALRDFDDGHDATRVRAHAEGFGQERFRRQMREVVAEVLEG